MRKLPVSLRLSAGAKDFHEQLEPGALGTQYVLEAMPGLYRETLKELKGRFTSKELFLMLDVSNGLLLNPALAGNQLPSDVEDGVLLDGLAGKWGVDGKVLVEKIHAMPRFSVAVLELWCRMFWNSGKNDSVGWVATLAAGKEA